MRVVLEGTDLPGGAGVTVGVQRRGEVVEPQPADASSVTWAFDVEVVDGPDFRGPFVQGKRGERFVYLSWGVVGPDASTEMFRRAKLMLAAVGPEVLEAASAPGAALVGRLGLTQDDGTPRCAAIRPPTITWSAEGP